MIPALKVLMANLTEDEAWHYLRPPLSRLDEEQENKLLSSVPLLNLL